ncbi:hypothetical protein ACJJTC_018999 [Scirpophaga incertulas]
MSVILFVLASALAAAVQAYDPSQCTKASSGTLEGLQLSMNLIMLRAGVWDWDIILPSNVCPGSMSVVGVVLTACDPDGPPPPEVEFLGRLRARVMRHTSAKHVGTVLPTVYCEALGKKSKDASVWFSSPKESASRGTIVRVVPRHVQSN